MKAQAKQGHRYRARIEVGFFKRSFASCEVIESKLREAGFSSVTAQRGTGAGEYWAWGVWSGEDTDAELPSEIVNVADLGPA